MTAQGTDTENPEERGGLLRPAVSPGKAGETWPAAGLEHPLGPFRRLLRDLYEAEPMAALVTNREEDDDEEEWPAPPPTLASREPDLDLIDLATNEEPWIDPALTASGRHAPGASIELPDFLIESDELLAGDDAFWLDFDAMESAATAPASVDAAEPRQVQELRDTELSLDDEALELTTLGESGPPEPTDRSTEAVPSDSRASGAEVVDEVATRLERIARSLRERSPADLLGRSDDPLQVLIAGYVLGLSDAARGSASRGDETS